MKVMSFLLISTSLAITVWHACEIWHLMVGFQKKPGRVQQVCACVISERSAALGNKRNVKTALHGKTLLRDFN